MKKILIGLACAAVVAGIALFLLVGNLDNIIKGALEGVGSELLGVPVTVADVELDLKSGTGQISGLTIANPAGFTARNAFEMNMIRLGLDIGSLGRQPLVVNELHIDSPVVELEAQEDGSSNVKTLLDNIEKNSARADKKAAEDQPEGGGGAAAEPVRISFRQLAITGVTVHAAVPGQEPATVVIPDIVMENVGGDAGVTPAQVGGIIIGDIVGRSLRATIEKKLSDKLEESARGLLDELKTKLLPQDGS